MKHIITRRNFIKGSSAAAAVLIVSPLELMAATSTSKKVVIIGGGIAGATAARYLRKFMPSTSALNIKIIEPKKEYITPFGSNEIITGERTLKQLTASYTKLKKEVKAIVVHAKAISLDNNTKAVHTSDGGTHTYDYCIVATGIGFEYSDIEGLDAQNNAQVPHAYDMYGEATEQITILKSQLEKMPANGKVILVAPKNSYRCPPAPYERAGQIAQFIKDNKPNATITILDPKGSFAKQDAFEEAWTTLYNYKKTTAKLFWKANTVVSTIRIDANKKTLITDDGTSYTADVVTYIPTMRASDFAYSAGLVKSGTQFDMAKRWCPVNLETFESTMPGKKGLYVIGDSSQTNLPKSGYAANSEAKACAMAIVANMRGFVMPEAIITNGCFSAVGKNYAISIFHKYRLSTDKTRYDLLAQGRRTSPLGKDLAWHAKEFKLAHAWYENFRNDCFGVGSGLISLHPNIDVGTSIPDTAKIEDYKYWHVGGNSEILAPTNRNGLVKVDGEIVAHMKAKVTGYAEMFVAISGKSTGVYSDPAVDLTATNSKHVTVRYKSNHEAILQIRASGVHGGSHRRATLPASPNTFKILTLDLYTDFNYSGITTDDLKKVGKFNFAFLSNNSQAGFSEITVSDFVIENYSPLAV